MTSHDIILTSEADQSSSLAVGDPAFPETRDSLSPNYLSQSSPCSTGPVEQRFIICTR